MNEAPLRTRDTLLHPDSVLPVGPNFARQERCVRGPCLGCCLRFCLQSAVHIDENEDSFLGYVAIPCVCLMCCKTPLTHCHSWPCLHWGQTWRNRNCWVNWKSWRRKPCVYVTWSLGCTGQTKISLVPITTSRVWSCLDSLSVPLSDVLQIRYRFGTDLQDQFFWKNLVCAR